MIQGKQQQQNEWWKIVSWSLVVLKCGCTKILSQHFVFIAVTQLLNETFNGNIIPVVKYKDKFLAQEGSAQG